MAMQGAYWAEIIKHSVFISGEEWRNVAKRNTRTHKSLTVQQLPIGLGRFGYWKRIIFEIYMADLKASAYSRALLFLLHCVQPAALPLVRCYSIRLPRRVASRVDYNRYELSRAQWALRQWSQLAEGRCIMMWKIATFGIEPTTSGSEGESATNYTTARHTRTRKTYAQSTDYMA
jgi:hypothetical protein